MTTTGFVYRLVCKDVDFTEIYIGSSISLRNRRANHKSNCSNVNNKSYNLPVYQYIRDSGGWANWELQIVERFEFEFKFELVARERHHMETLHATLNNRVPGRGRVEAQAVYYAKNVDKAKVYRAENADKINEKHDCPCGGRFTNANKSQHAKTKKHIKFLEAHQ